MSKTLQNVAIAGENVNRNWDLAMFTVVVINIAVILKILYVLKRCERLLPIGLIVLV